jgi:hypothetical protein
MGIVYPRSTGWVSETVFLNEGEPWDDSDPFVAQYPQHFSAEPGQALRGSGRQVEQATAAPGEKRDVTKTDAALDEANHLRSELTDAGVKVDNRWSLTTLREKRAELAVDEEEPEDDDE